MGTRLISNEPPDTVHACFETNHCLAMYVGHTGTCLLCEIMVLGLRHSSALDPELTPQLVPTSSLPIPSPLLELMV